MSTADAAEPTAIPGDETVRTTPVTEVAILFSRSIADYADVAEHVALLLSGELFHVTLADVDASSWDTDLRSLRGRPDLFLVAVGLPAARKARDEFDAPFVFAQVFNYAELLVEGRNIRGVASMPPLELVFQEWKNLDPDLGRVGVIASESYRDLTREAEHAAAKSVVEVRSATSSSDQETLYLFRRLTTEIDSFWLIPDDQILSPTVLRELLAYASSHGIGVGVSSDALLGWGALMSASSTTTNIARTVYSVLVRMTSGEAADVPVLTPLSEVRIDINEEVAEHLSLPLQHRASWTARN